MLTVFDDLRHAVRSLWKTPGLVLVAALSLGLSIGLNTTFFGVFNSLFLQPPSATGAHRLLRVWVGRSNRISYLNFRDLRQSGVFDALAAYRATELNLRTGDDVQRLFGAAVSESFSAITTTRALGTFSRTAAT